MSIRKYKKLVSASAPAITGLGLHHLFYRNYSGVGHILMFHRVLPREDRARVHNHESLEIDPGQLEETIQFFKRRDYDFPTLDQLPAYLTEQSTRKFVIFTFDDGYKDNLLHAYPVFKKYEVPFTIYITNNFINGTSVMWWYMLEQVLLANRTVSFRWEDNNYKFHCESLTQKEIVFDEMRRKIVSGLIPGRYHQQLKDLFSEYVDDLLQYTRQHALNWEEVRLLSEDPLVSIGAHTANHYPLLQLNAQELYQEICQSKEELEQQLGKKVLHFAYPFGKNVEVGQREYNYAKKQGFVTAVTTNMGNVFQEHRDHLHQLPRVNINALTSMDVLKLQTSGLVPFLKNGKKRIIV